MGRLLWLFRMECLLIDAEFDGIESMGKWGRGGNNKKCLSSTELLLSSSAILLSSGIVD